jgi:hypothetical protein
MPRYRKARDKARERKRRSGGAYALEESPVLPEEVVARTLNRLQNLGNQKFAVSPFSEHFGRWLMDLRVVLSEFESGSTVAVDDEFVRERSQILSVVEARLEEIRRGEASGGRVFKGLSDDRVLLEQMEEEYAARAKELEGRRQSEISRLSGNVDGLKGELNRVAGMKAGLFRRVSKKAKARREAEAAQRLSLAESELALAGQRFDAEQGRLRDEHEKKKQPVAERVRDYEKEVERQEIDVSLEVRRVACEALAGAVNVLLQRNASSTVP